jgi:putative ABC transport system substrate-binding protein
MECLMAMTTPKRVTKPTITRLATIAMVCLLATPLTAGAQPAVKVPRVGVLANGSAATSPPVDAFRRALREFGHVEGQNLMLEIRWAEGRFERLPELATELVRWKPDVLVAAGPYGLEAARRATTVIPIVMIACDPADTMDCLRFVSSPPKGRR